MQSETNGCNSNGSDVESIRLALTPSPFLERNTEAFYSPITVLDDQNVDESILLPESPVFRSRIKSRKKSSSNSSYYLSCESEDAMERSEMHVIDNYYSEKSFNLSTTVLVEEENECYTVIENEKPVIDRRRKNEHNIRDYISDFNPDSDNESCVDPLDVIEETSENRYSPMVVLSNIQNIDDVEEQIEDQVSSFNENLNTDDISMVISLYNDGQEKIAEELASTNIVFISNKVSENDLGTDSEFSSEENCNFKYSKKRAVISSSSETSEEVDINQEIKASRRKKISGNSTEIEGQSEKNYSSTSDTDLERSHSECTGAIREINRRYCKNPSTGTCRDYNGMNHSNVRAINKLRKCLQELGVPLRKYKDFWEDCKKNAPKLTRFAKLLVKKKLVSSEILIDPSSIKKEVEIYLESLILDKKLVISFNERITRSKTKANEILSRRKTLNHYKKYRSSKIKIVQMVPPKYKSLDYASLYKKISSIVDE